jgi:hypothetical protein
LPDCVRNSFASSITKTFFKSQQQTLKRKEKKRKEIKKEEDVVDELVNQFDNTMDISTKRRRVDDV